MRLQVPNNIFTNLLKGKIEIFVNSYTQLSRQVFYDETKKNKISHPGEFGAYREGLIKEFMQIFTPERLNIGSGFAINATEQVSSQLDVILYDAAVTPKIENSSHQRFFPIECICGVGEVKSVLRSKAELGDALERLWRVKGMATSLHPRIKHECDKPKMPFTFLFCEEIKAKPALINEWYVEIYEKNGIPKEQWHNVIASIRSGIFKYTTMQDISVGSSIIPKGGIISSPVSRGNIPNKNFHMPSRDHGSHLISFGHDLALEFGNRKGKSPDLIAYTDEYK
jgi:hypothetical protein